MLTAAYTASKHAIVGLTRSAALEFGAHKINVNAICPNHVTTQLGAWQNAFMAKARGQTHEDYMAAMRGRIPLGRVGLTERGALAQGRGEGGGTGAFGQKDRWGRDRH